MSAPIYFVPGEAPTETNQDYVRKVFAAHDLEHLSDTKDSLSYLARGVPGSGPGGQKGLMLGVAPADERGTICDPIGYYPDRQRWFEPDDDDEVWIGVETDSPVCPQDVLRTTVIQGHPVKLLDGHEWIIPVARCFPEGTRLPMKVLPKRDGSVEYEVRDEYLILAETADMLLTSFGLMREEEDGQAVVVETGLSVEEAMSVCLKAIGCNYRISWREVRAMELVDGDALFEITLALIDWPTFEQFQDSSKKKTGAQ